jgi:hypothetical protein
MHSAYSGARGREGFAQRYYCDPRIGRISRNGPDGHECQGLGGRQLDEAVLAEVFRVLEPAAIAATAKALADQEASEATRLRAFETAVERCRYEAERARRQFDACEPENRLVARTLEANLEKALRDLERAESDLATQRAKRTSPLTSDELKRLERAGADLRAVFHAPTTSQRDRKLLLRTLISEIVVTADRDSGTADATITWEGGATTELAPLKLRRQGQTYARDTPEDTIALVRRLAARYDDKTIAVVLANQRRRTATGLRFTKHRVAGLRTPTTSPPSPPTRPPQTRTASWSASPRPRASSASARAPSTGGCATGSSPASSSPRRAVADPPDRSAALKVHRTRPRRLATARRCRPRSRRRPPDRVASSPTRRAGRRARGPRQTQRPANPGQT